jgi:hypothetical protein
VVLLDRRATGTMMMTTMTKTTTVHALAPGEAALPDSGEVASVLVADRKTTTTMRATTRTTAHALAEDEEALLRDSDVPAASAADVAEFVAPKVTTMTTMTTTMMTTTSFVLRLRQ